MMANPNPDYDPVSVHDFLEGEFVKLGPWVVEIRDRPSMTGWLCWNLEALLSVDNSSTQH
jgi:hypothetical protein